MSIVDVIKENGIENVRVLINMKPIRNYFGFISMTSSSDPDILMLCEIVEDRYKVAKDYKITLQSIEQIKGIHGREHYYISDLNHIIKDGQAQILVNKFLD